MRFRDGGRAVPTEAPADVRRRPSAAEVLRLNARHSATIARAGEIGTAPDRTFGDLQQSRSPDGQIREQPEQAAAIQLEERSPYLPMPISYTIDATGRVHSRASGTVGYAEAQAYLMEKVRAGVLAAPEIFDARDVTLDFSMTELRAIAEEVRKTVDGTPGPVAFVTNSAFVKGLAEAYAALTRDHNPRFRIFTSLRDAEAWLEEVSMKCAVPQRL